MIKEGMRKHFHKGYNSQEISISQLHLRFCSFVAILLYAGCLCFTIWSINEPDGLFFGNNTKFNSTVISPNEGPLLGLLNDAGLANSSMVKKLPRWNTIRQMYGFDEAVILVGRETCQKFRDTVPANDRWLAVAGMYNTGTNLLSKYLMENCRIPGAKGKFEGILWQVPWGKHVFPSRKWNNTNKSYTWCNKTATLPIVITRDPFQWFQSMCSHPYGLKWMQKECHCPKLISSVTVSKNQTMGIPIPVKLVYKNDTMYFPSIVHVWKDYYSEYVSANYPRIIVRYEDMIFRPQKTIQEACDCVGGQMKAHGFTFFSQNLKYGVGGHGTQEQEGLLNSVLKNGSPSRRVKNLTTEDIMYTHSTIGARLLELFKYTYPRDEIKKV